MMMHVGVFMALIGLLSAGSLYHGNPHFTQHGRYQYHGVYGGHCGHDGVYIQDADSLVLCSNGIAYYQLCPPGTKNSGYNTGYENYYTSGSYYNLDVFCDVNLVALGYGPYGQDRYSHSHYDGRVGGYHGDVQGHGYHGDIHTRGYHDTHPTHSGYHDAHHGSSYHGNVHHPHGHQAAFHGTHYNGPIYVPETHSHSLHRVHGIHGVHGGGVRGVHGAMHPGAAHHAPSYGHAHGNSPNVIAHPHGHAMHH